MMPEAHFTNTMTQEASLPFRTYDLPWSLEAGQEQRFRRTLRNCAIGLLGLALILSFLPVPERDLAELREVPPRFASLIMEREPPPVVEPEPEPEPEPVVDEPEPEPEALADVPPEEPAPAPALEPVAEPEPVPVDQTQLARERASVAGLLPLTATLASLREDSTTERLDEVQVNSVGDPDIAVPERSLITSSVGTDSGGINIGELSRNTGGEGLQARATTRVESPVGGGGSGTGAGTGAAGMGRGEAGGAGSGGSRSREEIERVFDRNKGAIYALYNRALRQNPLLEGKLVLRLTIEPDGRVSFCEVVSSELGDPELEQRLVQRVLLFQFEPRDVEPVTTTKPIDFFPA